MNFRVVLATCYSLLAIASLLNKQIQANNNNVYIGMVNIQIVTDIDF